MLEEWVELGIFPDIIREGHIDIREMEICGVECVRRDNSQDLLKIPVGQLSEMAV